MISRRRLLTRALLTPLSGLGVLVGLRALGAPAGGETHPLDEQEVAAKAVAYQKDARKVDPGRFPAYRRGQSCTTCA